jgi:hypothetical protein
VLALAFVFESVAMIRLASIAMMATTTRSSIRVKPGREGVLDRAHLSVVEDVMFMFI